MDRKPVARYAVREIASVVGMAVALFWSAGKLDWWPAWASIAVMMAWVVATAIVIFQVNPDLLPERLERRSGDMRWDAAIVSAIGLIQLIRYIIAGLDERNGWTTGISLTAQIVAFCACVFGYALFVWATATNSFFSRFVRLLPARGHRVVASGPYRFLRHPAYAGAILFELAVSILLASWWALLVSCLSASLLVLRTILEDRFLAGGLAGYEGYTRSVRYRLLPRIW